MQTFYSTNYKFYLSFLFCIILTGCVIPNIKNNVNDLDCKKNYDQIQKLKTWKLFANIGFITPKQATSGYLKLSIQKDEYIAHLGGIVGEPILSIYGNNNNALIKQPQHSNIQTNNANDFLAKNLGFNFPLKQLKFWLKGIASSQNKVVYLNTEKDSCLRSFQQDNWLITYQRDMKWHNLVMPNKILLTNKKYSIKVKIFVKYWQ